MSKSLREASIENLKCMRTLAQSMSSLLKMESDGDNFGKTAVMDMANSLVEIAKSNVEILENMYKEED